MSSPSSLALLCLPVAVGDVEIIILLLRNNSSTSSSPYYHYYYYYNYYYYYYSRPPEAVGDVEEIARNADEDKRDDDGVDVGVACRRITSALYIYV